MNEGRNIGHVGSGIFGVGRTHNTHHSETHPGHVYECRKPAQPVLRIPRLPVSCYTLPVCCPRSSRPVFCLAVVSSWAGYSLSNSTLFKERGCLLKEKVDFFSDFLITFLDQHVLSNILVCQGCCNKIPQTGLTQQKYIVSQFQRLDIQDQAVSRVGSF